MKQTIITALLALITMTGLAQVNNGKELFGPNVFIYSPKDDMQAVADEVNALHEKMFHDQFSQHYNTRRDNRTYLVDF